MSMSRLPTLAAAAAFLLVFPEIAAAHTGGTLGGFGAGALHPLTGLDHALAMLTLGALAGQRGGRALWIVPTSFVAAMLLGGALGVGGAGVPAVEIFIALSVGATGLALAGGRAPSLATLAAAAAAIAVFHGYAHGTEMAAGGSLVAFGAGMALSTAVLHAVGIALVDGAGRPTGVRWGVLLRAGGGAVAAIGLVLLVSVI